MKRNARADHIPKPSQPAPPSQLLRPVLNLHFYTRSLAKPSVIRGHYWVTKPNEFMAASAVPTTWHEAGLLCFRKDSEFAPV
jgi:hypothetical protein